MAGTPAAEISVSADLVRALLADQHPQYAPLPIAFSGEGWDNFTFRLGDDLAVRMPRRKISVALLLNEQRWLPKLASSLPIAITAPIAIGTAAHGFPWPWSVVPWIDGVPVDHAPLGDDQGLVLASFLRALHQPAPADAPTNPFRGVPLRVRRERIDQCLERVRRSSDLITPAIDGAWAQALTAPASKASVWLHGDMHAQNMLSEHGKLAGVIDWGDMCGGDAATDLGAIWGVLGSTAAREAALRAYGPDDALLARARGWAILFGVTLFDNGRVDDPRHAAIGEATLRRLANDL